MRMRGSAEPGGRDERPAFDRLLKDATRRKFDMVVAWSVERGPSRPPTKLAQGSATVLRRRSVSSGWPLASPAPIFAEK